MFGYACNETVDLLPAPIWYAHRIMQRQSELRKDGRLPWLRPDARLRLLSAISMVNLPRLIPFVSTQHHPDISKQILRAG